MAHYVMLLWENPAVFAKASPTELNAVVQEYVGWRRKMGAEGKVTGGHKLKDEGGKHLTAAGVKDGPYAEVSELIGGLFIIQADGYDEAVAIAKSCPHVKYGRVELREIEPTPAPVGAS